MPCRRRSRPVRGPRRGRPAGRRRPRSPLGGSPPPGHAGARRRRRPPGRRPPRWSATRCSDRGGRAAPARPRPDPRTAHPCRGARPGASRCPGVQNPHWLAPVAQNASDQARCSSSSRPSTVVTARPAMRRAGVTQATRGAPSTSTVQHPHWPWGLHPSLTLRAPEAVPEHLEQRGAVVGDLDRLAVQHEGDAARHRPDDRFARRESHQPARLPDHHRRRRAAHGLRWRARRRGQLRRRGSADDATTTTGRPVARRATPSWCGSSATACWPRARPSGCRSAWATPTACSRPAGPSSSTSPSSTAAVPWSPPPRCLATPKGCPVRTGRSSLELDHAGHLHGAASDDRRGGDGDVGLHDQPGRAGGHPEGRRAADRGGHAHRHRRPRRHADLHADPACPLHERDPDRSPGLGPARRRPDRHAGLLPDGHLWARARRPAGPARPAPRRGHGPRRDLQGSRAGPQLVGARRPRAAVPIWAR